MSDDYYYISDYHYTFSGDGGTDWLAVGFCLVLMLWGLSGLAWAGLVIAQEIWQ